MRPFVFLRLSDGTPVLREDPAGAWVVAGEGAGGVSASLALLASAMRAAGLAGAWRDEALAVCTEQGVRVGQVERAAVRPLGIATQAVHLVGLAVGGEADGDVWVQQRALNKANDPGLWDTLMGGMVAAVDTLDTALARETWEEAGLQLAQLSGLRRGGCIETRRPSTDGAGAGYVVEQITWYQAVLPPGVLPDNQDGEVAQFARLTQAEVLMRIQRGEFTQEAALILAHCLLPATAMLPA